MGEPEESEDDFLSGSLSLDEFLMLFDKGDLDTEDLARGCHLCFKNAEALLEDAELLQEDRPERAISLAILATEELGKLFLLYNAACFASRRPIPWKEIRQRLRLKSHQEKQRVFRSYGRLLRDDGVEDKETEDDFGTGAEKAIDRMKQLGFYVDVADGEFISPAEFGADNAVLAELFIRSGRNRLESVRQFHDTEDDSKEFARMGAGVVAWVAQASTLAEAAAALSDFIETYRKKR